MKYFIDNKSRVGSVIILLFSLIYLNLAIQLPTDPIAGDEYFSSKTLPIILAILSIICCLLKIALPVDEDSHESISEEVEGYAWKPSSFLMLITLVYTLSFDFLGFILATILLLTSGFMVLKEKSWKRAFAVASILTMTIWAILTQIFGLFLTAGNFYYQYLGGQ